MVFGTSLSEPSLVPRPHLVPQVYSCHVTKTVHRYCHAVDGPPSELIVSGTQTRPIFDGSGYPRLQNWSPRTEYRTPPCRGRSPSPRTAVANTSQRRNCPVGLRLSFEGEMKQWHFAHTHIICRLTIVMDSSATDRRRGGQHGRRKLH